MPIIDSPKIDYMPSFIDGLKNGYRLDNMDPRSDTEIERIEKDTELFFNNFVERKTKPVISESDLNAAPIERSEFWCTDGFTYIGRVNIRHALNNELNVTAGNIGFEVVPKYQRQGYAAAMLDFGLDFLRQKTDLTKALLITDDTNENCIKFIEKNHGILDNTVRRTNNTLIRRYWITL